MRLLAGVMVVIPALLFAPSLAQWRSTKLVGGMAFASYAGPQIVNANGQATFYARPPSGYQDAYRNSQNVSSWLGSPRTAYSFGIDAAGDVGYGASTGGNKFHVYVDSNGTTKDWSGGVLDPAKSWELSGAGLLSDGRPVWNAKDLGANGSADLYIGSANMSASLFNVQHDAGAGWINSKDQVLWRAFRYDTGLTDLYLDNQSITAPLFGNSPHSFPSAALNDAGDVAYTVGYYDQYGTHQYDVFVNNRNFTQPILGDVPHFGGMYGLNNRGDVLWGGGLNGAYSDTWLNGANISAPIFAGANHHADPLALNSSGVVAWEGRWLDLGHGVLYKGTVDISDPVLGAFAFPDEAGVGLDDSGRLLWRGRGINTQSQFHVFVDDFDLSAAVLGDDAVNWVSAPVAIGANGDVLWTAHNVQTGLYNVYLSSPVPEPSMLILGAPLLLLALRRGRRR